MGRLLGRKRFYFSGREGALVDPNVVDIAGERRLEIGGFGETDSEVYRAGHWIVRQRRRADLPTFMYIFTSPTAPRKTTVMFDHRFSSLGATTYSPSNPIGAATIRAAFDIDVEDPLEQARLSLIRAGERCGCA
jgi:hypothetical protein